MNREGEVGLFGGTFNPIHFGHLNLAVVLKEHCNLSKVFFVPTACSPFRSNETLESASHRLKMVELGIQNFSGFDVLDLEIRRGGLSYTIETIRELQKIHPHLVLLLGEDAVIGLLGWKEIEEIVRLVPLRIACRLKEPLLHRLQSLHFPPFLETAVRQGIVETPLLDISASQIRRRLSEGLPCLHLLPSKVLDYIHVNQLYFIPVS